MIKTTKGFVDKSGGVRIYIPRDIVAEIQWQDGEPLILSTDGNKLIITAETARENQSWLNSLKKESSESKAAKPSPQEVPTLILKSGIKGFLKLLLEEYWQKQEVKA